MKKDQTDGINEGFSCSISLIVGIIIFCQQMVYFRLEIIEGCFYTAEGEIFPEKKNKNQK
jgi:hypothetical protein